MGQVLSVERIFVAGHNGMVGASICRELERSGNCELVLRSRADLDLRDQSSVKNFFDSESIDQVYLAAAKVGGIQANSNFPADFIYDNLMIQTNVIHGSFRAGITQLLFLGSSCIYPRLAPQPISEQQLLSGYLEPTNEPYAIAKIAGLKLCESLNRQFGESHGIDYRSVMPCNLYGPGDNYHGGNSHVIPALIKKFHRAKTTGQDSVMVLGSGKPIREFLHVDDLAQACLTIMNLSKEKYLKATDKSCSHLNVGSGHEISIRDLALLIGRVIGFRGEIRFDKTQPDGTPRKILDCRRMHRLEWNPSVSLESGLAEAYDDFLKKIGE